MTSFVGFHTVSRSEGSAVLIHLHAELPFPRHKNAHPAEDSWLLHSSEFDRLLLLEETQFSSHNFLSTNRKGEML